MPVQIDRDEVSETGMCFKGIWTALVLAVCMLNSNLSGPSYGTLGIDGPGDEGKTEKTANSTDRPIMIATEAQAIRL